MGKRMEALIFSKTIYFLDSGAWFPNQFYDALRNGLAHSFSTKVIVNAADTPIELGISWSKETHFSYDSSRSVLFLNIQQLSKDLCGAFSQYQSELQQAADLRDRFVRWRQKQRVYQVQNEGEREKWNALVEQAVT
jgi:hypothetical protein